MRIKVFEHKLEELERDRDSLLREKDLLVADSTVHRVVGDDGTTPALVVLPDLTASKGQPEV